MLLPDPDELQAAASFLRSAGFTPIVPEAIRDVVAPDVVLLDLPRCSRELPARLRSLAGLRVPVIVMSADGQSLPRIARALGAWAWVKKPVEPARLRASLRAGARAQKQQPSLLGLPAQRR